MPVLVLTRPTTSTVSSRKGSGYIMFPVYLSLFVGLLVIHISSVSVGLFNVDLLVSSRPPNDLERACQGLRQCQYI